MQQTLTARRFPPPFGPGAMLAPLAGLRRTLARALAPRQARSEAWLLAMLRSDETAGPALTAAEADRFRDTVLPHLDAAYNLARYLSRDPVAAEDIVQDAFVRAFRGFAHFRGGSARAWILAIVRNCCHTWRSGRQRDLDVMETGWEEDAFDDPDAVAAADPDTPETALIRSDEAGAVRAVLEALPAPFREVMVLREIEDLSYREIAEITGLPLGTVMSRLARARDAFRAAWHCRLPQGEATP